MEREILEAKRVMEIARKTQIRLETRLEKEFNLTYCSVSTSSVSIETKYHSARINSWNMDSKVNSRCYADDKEINTAEEFMAMKEIIKQDRYNILYALFYIAFRQFRGEQ